MVVEPEASISPPVGNDKPLEEISGGGRRVYGAGLVGNCMSQVRMVRMTSFASPPPSVSVTIEMHSTPASQQAGRLEASLPCTPTSPHREHDPG